MGLGRGRGWKLGQELDKRDTGGKKERNEIVNFQVGVERQPNRQLGRVSKK